ncbi:hypothetical protein D3C84_1045710 [compost metagenome]
MIGDPFLKHVQAMIRGSRLLADGHPSFARIIPHDPDRVCSRADMLQLRIRHMVTNELQALRHRDRMAHYLHDRAVINLPRLWRALQLR